MTVEPVTYPEVWADGQAKVFVWGLNDKDQLGGLKGSKVKLPIYSEALSALRPIHIAGGSKSLFIVSYDGKVCIEVVDYMLEKIDYSDCLF